MLGIVHKYLGYPDKKIITIPNWMYAMGGRELMKEQKARNIEGGLNMVKFTDLQCSRLFIDKSLGCDFLGVEPDDIDKAIGDSIKLCVDIMDKNVHVLNMKGE
jgi:dihydroflavonol-4-reductase